jgi:Ca2+-binding RTX toxin-like protein
MTDNFPTSNVDTFDQGDGDDALVITVPNELNAGDIFIGGAGVDTISALVSLDLRAVTLEGGFYGYEGLSIGGNFTVEVSANQFGAGLISNALHVTGEKGSGQGVVVFAVSNFSAAHWTFTDWTPTEDTVAIVGSSAGNVLTGSSQGDIIFGDEGADILTGGRGRDELNGGDDNDTFRFVSTKDSPKGKPDLIDDFFSPDGDRIDLHKIDANTKATGNQAFHFIDDQGFHHKAGELHWVSGATSVFVEGDVNGDGKADFSIELGNRFEGVAKGDFIL